MQRKKEGAKQQYFNGYVKVNGQQYSNEKEGVRYIVQEDQIFWVEKTIDTKLKLDPVKDKESLLKCAFDYMPKDVILIQTTSNSEHIYESPTTKKKYSVSFVISVSASTTESIIGEVVVGQVNSDVKSQ